MASNTVEKIFVELLLNASGYSKEADNAIKKGDALDKGLQKTEKQSKETAKSFDTFVVGLKKTIKGVAGLAAVIAAGTGLLRLAEEARKANDELNFLSKNLGMSSQEVKAWQGAAAAMGGSAQGMAGDMKALNSSMNDFVMTGESSMLPMFNTLGVSMIDAQGKVRNTNDVMLDLADTMSKMDREQAFLMGQKLGFDEGTINTLLQGRDAMQEMVNYHKQMYSSNKQELEASRKLSENQAKLSAHWQSMKLMMGNAIIPLLVKLSNIALRFFEFLQRHQATVKHVFEGMAIFLGMMVVPMLGKALIALLAFIAPFAPFIVVVAALGAAFVALYDDYKTWAEGGQSLFDWGAFKKYIDDSKISVDSLKDGFAYLLTGYTSWSEVAKDGKAWLAMKGFIDENGVSLETLRKGFANLTTDLIQYMIPTLKEYGEIFQKLITGDFLGASKQAANMMANLGNKILSVFGTSGQEIADYISSGGQTRAPWQGAKDRISGATDVATGQTPKVTKNDAPSQFIQKYWGMASKIAKELGVPTEFILSQFAAETGWGKKVIKGTNNLGNIKAGKGWKGKTVSAYDEIEKSYADYRVYENEDEFAKDYLNLIGKKQYKNVKGSKTAKDFYQNLKNSGYATDRDYVQKGVDVYDSVMRRIDKNAPSSDLKFKKGNVMFKGKNVVESIGGGNVERGTLEFARNLQKSLGSNLYHFGAFNDVYHQQRSPNSKHTKGLAFDITLAKDGRKATEAEGRKLAPMISKEIQAQLEKIGLKAGDYKILDEYNKPSSKATAGHIHVEFTSKQAADAYAISQGAAKAQQSMPKANIPVTIAKPSGGNTNTTEVNIKEINVNTSASTVTGTMADAMSAVKSSNLYQYPVGVA